MSDVNINVDEKSKSLRQDYACSIFVQNVYIPCPFQSYLYWLIVGPIRLASLVEHVVMLHSIHPFLLLAYRELLSWEPHYYSLVAEQP